MPSHLQTYEVLLDFINDSRDCATIQLLRDYGQTTGAIVFLHPGESITLVLDAGSIYRYALKTHSRVANVTRGETFAAMYRRCLPVYRRLHIMRALRQSMALPSTVYGEIIGCVYGMTLSTLTRVVDVTLTEPLCGTHNLIRIAQTFGPLEATERSAS